MERWTKEKMNRPRTIILILTMRSLFAITSSIAQTNQMAYAKSVNVHSIIFKNKPVIEVFNFLRDASVQCCPDGNQINLVLNVTDESIVGTNPMTRVTVKFDNINLYEALIYLAEATDLDLRFDENAVVLSDRKRK
ncbi:MAG TPA: hypothetical protein DCZ95_13440 [Verrucomicrobia bacterium]|nr:MAG: hypothetical protein A2X46_11295 [Lentisphaerae bacterium GWF2_57_35]HBA85087.1 hypothetical protein [Verrucomicrobiota bacterium]